MDRSDWRQLSILAWLSLLACAPVLAATSMSEIVTTNVGGQQILIPAPELFTQTTTPRMIQIGELSTIKEDRLLAVFLTTVDAEEEAKGGTFGMDRYGFVQAARNVEPYQIPLDRFGKYKADTKAQVISELSAEERVEVQKNTERSMKWFEHETGANAQIGVPHVGSVAILNETPTSLTMVTKIATPLSLGRQNQKSVEMVIGSSQMLAKSKVIWLQLYARFDSREDFDWVVKNIVNWTRAVNAANTGAADTSGANTSPTNAGVAIDADSNRTITPAITGINAFAIKLLGCALGFGILAYVGWKLHGLGNGQLKNDPFSKALREGNLAFRNAIEEEANPYSDQDKKLAEAWLSGYRKAANASRSRKVPT